LLGLGRASDALTQLAPMITAIDATPPEERFVSVGRIGRWRFAYAQALWLVNHQAGPARAAAKQARTELERPADQAAVDAWLATLPR
jgi:hypothetical protein